MSVSFSPYEVPESESGETLAAILRKLLPGQSWTQVRKVVASRRIQIDGTLCLDPARRVKQGEQIESLNKPKPVSEGELPEQLVVRHLDDHVVVVEKASGVNTVRHPAEREWTDQRRALSPTLEDLTQIAIAKKLHKSAKSLPRLRIVHRLDKETSGLVVFARSAIAERGLGKQFHAHSVIRRYIAIIRGFLAPQTIRSWLIRDRGDGRRGSSATEGVGKLAVTHIDVLERFPEHTLLLCQLETGRTHQIRIHLAEAGHPVCGEKVYNRNVIGEIIESDENTTRLALHAAELGFEHPETNETMYWDMPLPEDLQKFLDQIRTPSR